MKKPIIVLVLISILGISTWKIWNDEKTQNVEESKQDVASPCEEEEQGIVNAGSILNQAQWDEPLQEMYSLICQGMNQYAEEARGSFVPNRVEEDGYTDELIALLEEGFYDSYHHASLTNTVSESESNPFYEALAKLGSEEYSLDLEEMCLLFPELEEWRAELNNQYDAYHLIAKSESCIGMYRIFQGENEFFVFVYDRGGALGACDVVVKQRTGDSFTEIGRFYTESDGQIIKFKDSFFLVCGHYNFNADCWDGFSLYNVLGDSPQEESITVQYLPEENIWENIYYSCSEDLFDEELDQYIGTVKEELRIGEYLEDGSLLTPHLFVGNEEKEEDISVPISNYHNTIYKADIFNMGVPIYMSRASVPSSGKWSRWYLRASFYLYDEQTNNLRELENLSITSPQYGLVQMWFQTINEKVVTFRLYHVSDYNYLLNVSLWEGDQNRTLRNEVIVPKRLFQLNSPAKIQIQG